MRLIAELLTDDALQYPATDVQIRARIAEVLGPRRIGAAALAKDLTPFRIFEVAPTTPPEPAADERVVEVAPSLVDGTWTQQWSVETLSAPDQTAALRAARDYINSVADRALPDLTTSQQAAIAEVVTAQIDDAPTPEKYVVVAGYRAGAGGTFPQAIAVVNGWRATIAAVEQARAAATKELIDNGLAGIPAARAIMDAL